MKKYIAILLISVMSFACLSACGDKDVPAENNPDKISIVTTIFPENDWVLNVLGEKAADADVTMLLDNGVDLHSYQPTAEDIVKISNCDLLVYVGGESDDWVDDLLKEAINENMIAINLLDVLGDSAKQEEVVEGMQEVSHNHDHDEHEHDEDADHDEHEHDEDADHDEHEHDEDTDHDEHEHDEEADHDEHEHEESDEHHEHEHEAELDEHVWLSLKNSSKLVAEIAGALKAIDSENADIYAKNADAYIAKINALDKEYEAAVAASSSKTLLFGDRFPFRYMVDDYGIDYYAAFVGCSSETEASFETIMFLAEKVDELSLNSVMTIEGAEHKIAETIVKNTSSKEQEILTLDSMQSTKSEDVEAGISYLSVMESNLAVLKEALK